MGFFAPCRCCDRIAWHERSGRRPRGRGRRAAQYEQAAKAFAQSIRAENPDAAIIFTMGLIIDDLYPNLENVVRELNESGDTNVYSFRHEYGNEGIPAWT